MRGVWLSEEQKTNVLAAYINGVSVTKIAKDYGISDSYPTRLANLMGYPSRTALRQRRGWKRAIKTGPIIV